MHSHLLTVSVENLKYEKAFDANQENSLSERLDALDALITKIVFGQLFHFKILSDLHKAQSFISGNTKLFIGMICISHLLRVATTKVLEDTGRFVDWIEIKHTQRVKCTH